MTTASTESALHHLRRIKPNDGWAVEKTSSGGFRLLRRNVPLTNNSFLDIYHDSDEGSVVGILNKKSDGSVLAQVLVDGNGKPAGGKVRLVTITSWKTATTTRTRTSSSFSAAESTSSNTLSDEENKALLKNAAYIIGSMLALKVLSQAIIGVYILALPLIYIYMIANCPSNESFEAKKEVKRVLRGHHLPEDHPDKPKGFLSETLARMTAAVTTEIATGFGYEVTMIPVAGAATVASVVIPSAKMQCYWVGAFGKWWYVYSHETSSD